MNCTFDQNTIDDVITFHRHSCPGLAIGIRAAEYALQEFPDTAPAEFLCITETDMCGVDAIQYLTGCSFGKGNLIHRDYGKTAFSFYDRKQKKGLRLLYTPDLPAELMKESSALSKLLQTGPLSESDMVRNTTHRKHMTTWIMSSSLDELYSAQSLPFSPPRRAQVLQSLSCENCGEKTMESRTRQYTGKTLCIPCFEKVEQKI